MPQGAIVSLENHRARHPTRRSQDHGLPGQRVGSGVTLTSMFGFRYSVSNVTFETRPFTLSGSA